MILTVSECCIVCSIFTRISVNSEIFALGGCELHLTAIRLEEAKKHARSRRNGFYEALGVPQSSRQVDIKQAYLRIAKKHHPDRAGHENTESREIFDVSQYFKKMSK